MAVSSLNAMANCSSLTKGCLIFLYPSWMASSNVGKYACSSRISSANCSAYKKTACLIHQFRFWSPILAHCPLPKSCTIYSFCYSLCLAIWPLVMPLSGGKSSTVNKSISKKTRWPLMRWPSKSWRFSTNSCVQFSGYPRRG